MLYCIVGDILVMLDLAGVPSVSAFDFNLSKSNAFPAKNKYSDIFVSKQYCAPIAEMPKIVSAECSSMFHVGTWMKGKCWWKPRKNEVM